MMVSVSAFECISSQGWFLLNFCVMPEGPLSAGYSLKYNKSNFLRKHTSQYTFDFIVHWFEYISFGDVFTGYAICWTLMFYRVDFFKIKLV